MISIVTINAAMQDVRILGFSFYCPVKYVDIRLQALSEQLKKLDVDIICLQELFHADLQHTLYTSVKSIYPYTTGFAHPGFKLRLGSEFLILSKFPLANGQLIRFCKSAPEEYLFTSKGFYTADVDIPGFDRLHLINFHMTAGGVHRHPQHDQMETVRTAQIRQMLEYVHSDIPTVLAGDLNAGPYTSEANYNELLRSGIADTCLQNNDSLITWDQDNPLVSTNRESHLPPQKIDHVFLNPAAAAGIDVKGCRLVLSEHCVPLPGGENIPVSDHYGLQVELEIK